VTPGATPRETSVAQATAVWNPVRVSAPRRIQRRRRRGWRIPAGAVYVGRPSTWGNPYWVTRSSDYHGLAGSWFVLDRDGTTYHPDVDTESAARETAVALFEASLHGGSGALTPETVRAELAGRDLVCWCPLDEPCHADVLLAVANADVPLDDRAPASPSPTPSRSSEDVRRSTS